MRIGIGYDVHKLVYNRKLILGGVEFKYEKGLLGHSDADVLVKLMEEKSYKIGNLDTVIICEMPKISPKREEIQKKLAKHLKTDIENVSIKASTSEKLSFTGRGEGIEARAVVLLEKID